MSTKWLWVRRIVIVIGGLPAAALTIYFIVAHIQLNRAIAETDAIDPKWRIADIEATRAKIPDNENSALVIDHGHSLISKDAPWFDKDDRFWEFNTHPAHRLTTDQVALIRGVTERQAATMAEYRKISKMPRGRFPLTLIADITKTLPNNSMHARSAVVALRYDLYDRLEENDIVGASNRLMACINAGRSIGDEPFLISALVRFAVDATTLSASERFLGQCEADEATLAKLQVELEKVESDPVVYWGLRGERGYGFAMFEYIRSNPGKVNEGNGDNKLINSIFAHLNLFNRSQAALLRYMNDLVALSYKSPETWFDKLDALDRRGKELPILADLSSSSMVKTLQGSQRHYASLRCMITAVAAERYRLKHGKWPAKLDDLVTDKFLPKVPLDPYDGKPLRWRETPTGRIVYSVYRGTVDNGGDLGRGKALDETCDIGYELFDPAKRRQPPPG